MPRILVVDDEQLIAAMVRDWLNELGCEVAGPAYCVREALDLIASVTVDGAILDVSLGGEDCYPVADALCGAGIPVAFATGYGVSALPPRFKGMPVLSKPFCFESVKSVIATIAGSHVRL
jgi:CheY-like chemotaxis protein